MGMGADVDGGEPHHFVLTLCVLDVWQNHDPSALSCTLVHCVMIEVQFYNPSALTLLHPSALSRSNTLPSSKCSLLQPSAL